MSRCLKTVAICRDLRHAFRSQSVAEIAALVYEGRCWGQLDSGNRNRLAQRRAKKPDTKAGQIWALWPEIRAALDDGQSFKSIVEGEPKSRCWNRLSIEEDSGKTVTRMSARKPA